ncbi:molybdopterin molybdenumtransferase MoeA [Frondihabitans sucicola]|uniref:Molybdopterin molybdenumtransferase n=1 Tax=Frondihabitans sucicola TaxID=1268041 RepID=A0ABM8GMT7_9MICO|nr:molybdopterin molybdotransferase MoeA [Frondihabitans sucicola]BDZ49751.1 molybdopterin molybdenumtransferase MoeA [Frondihabitans sucicola]
MTVTRPEWTEARALAHAEALGRPRATERVPLAEAAFRTVATELRSPGRVPGFDASAMDGWAVSGEGPWAVGAPIVAGAAVDVPPLAAGAARPVTTGAAVPPGTDRVLRSESGRVDGGVLAENGPASGRPDHAGSDRGPAVPSPRHIRRAGEEAERDDLLFAAGTVLTPPRVAVAAVCGLDEVPVVVPPRVALAVLGDEIVGSGVPLPGTVRDVFSVQVPDVLRRLGAVPVSSERVPDELARTVAALDRPDTALVVTTGGTAHGSTDHVRAALGRLGADLVIDRVALRPGQPLLVARRGETLYLCLPGNPMAALVGLVLVGTPLIDGLLGRATGTPAPVTLAVDVEHPRPGSLVQAYRMTSDGAVPMPRQSSAMLRGLADADGLLVVPEGGSRAGDSVASLALPW